VSLCGVTGKRALRQRVSIDEVKAAGEQLKAEPWDTFIKKRGDLGAFIVHMGIASSLLFKVERAWEGGRWHGIRGRQCCAKAL